MTNMILVSGLSFALSIDIEECSQSALSERTNEHELKGAHPHDRWHFLRADGLFICGCRWLYHVGSSPFRCL